VHWLKPVIPATWEVEMRRISVLHLNKKAGCGGTHLSSQLQTEELIKYSNILKNKRQQTDLCHFSNVSLIFGNKAM
jgi:hypothetical protein